jgi:hypothetical protein
MTQFGPIEIEKALSLDGSGVSERSGQLLTHLGHPWFCCYITAGVPAAKILTSSASPLNACMPRSSKLRPEPATRSLSTLEVRTSPCARQLSNPRGDMYGNSAHVI